MFSKNLQSLRKKIPPTKFLVNTILFPVVNIYRACIKLKGLVPFFCNIILQHFEQYRLGRTFNFDQINELTASLSAAKTKECGCCLRTTPISIF